MNSKQILQNGVVKTLILFATLLMAAACLVKGWYAAELLFVPLTAWLLYGLYRYHRRAEDEVQQFLDTIRHRDFSRNFNTSQVSPEIRPLREGFNEITDTFKRISKEKETQFLYLKNILDIVDTGILSYDAAQGQVLWMNEALKQLLQIPYLKTIHSLEKRNGTLYQAIESLGRGQKTVTTIPRHNTHYKVQLSATMFENEGRTYKLIAFQNINDALDEGESQAWQKLLSVMTHEIMNSVAPIASLAETMKSRLAETGTRPKLQETLADLETGISTIKKRSEGLLKFTETYRSLSRINKISPAPVYVSELFEHVQQLMQPGADQRGITLDVILKDPTVRIHADSALIEQVLINLMLNAMDAVKDQDYPSITLSAEKFEQRPVIRISDNGSGISPELLDKIFIPFFSTKKSGNGIGLSLCKQVMMLHKGQISVQSAVGEGTVFSLSFDQPARS